MLWYPGAAGAVGAQTGDSGACAGLLRPFYEIARLYPFRHSTRFSSPHQQRLKHGPTATPPHHHWPFANDIPPAPPLTVPSLSQVRSSRSQPGRWEGGIHPLKRGQPLNGDFVVGVVDHHRDQPDDFAWNSGTKHFWGISSDPQRRV